MNGKSRTGSMKRKLAAAGLVLSIGVTAGNVFGGQKKGANVIVTLKGYREASGELIAVKPASILILDHAGKDVSFDLKEIVVVTVFTKAKPGKGAGVGLLVGFGIGYAFGAAVSANDQEDFHVDRGMGLIAGGAGLLIGLVAGAASGGPRDFDLLGVSQETLKKNLKTLNKYARYKEFM